MQKREIMSKKEVKVYENDIQTQFVFQNLPKMVKI